MRWVGRLKTVCSQDLHPQVGDNYNFSSSTQEVTGQSHTPQSRVLHWDDKHPKHLALKNQQGLLSKEPAGYGK